MPLSFKRDFENDPSKLQMLVDSRLENQRIWLFVLTEASTVTQTRYGSLSNPATLSRS